MKHIHSEESGRSMVEMLGVLAIVGVLSVGGIAGYSQAMSKFKVTKAMDQVQTIITNIRTLYASQRIYTSLSAAQALSMGILTEESYDSTSKKGLNPFGGNIYFGVADSGRTFSVTYTGLTGEACVKMATADWGADQSSGLRGMGVGTLAADAKDSKIAVTHTWANATEDDYKGETALPVTVASAADLCGDGQNGAVTWYYR